MHNGILSEVDGLRKVICITEPGEYTSNSLITYEDGDGHWYYGIVNWDEDRRGCSNNGFELSNSEQRGEEWGGNVATSMSQRIECLLKDERRV